jgi:hypothetical protein
MWPQAGPLARPVDRLLNVIILKRCAAGDTAAPLVPSIVREFRSDVPVHGL